jgi:hypothetical protein
LMVTFRPLRKWRCPQSPRLEIPNEPSFGH